MDVKSIQPPGADPLLKPTRKRRRTVISCTECHRRKQKCDRQLPCSNCVFRNKQTSCQYGNESTITKPPLINPNVNVSSDDDSQSPTRGSTALVGGVKVDSDSAAHLNSLGYANSNGHNSLGIFKKIENHAGGHLASPKGSNFGLSDHNQLKESYKSLVRQLPARIYVDKLLITFFKEVNWHYSSIDEEIFMDHLQSWNRVSFSVLNRRPQDLPGDIRFFPALLFQVLALALQFQSPDHDPMFQALKYVSEMSLDDLANDYSESGQSLLSLLGKRDISLVTIQADFLRTSFLKNNGLVTESWHSLGQTIRDAQEIGWHKDPINPRPQNQEKALEMLWLGELRKRLWTNLQIWDAHMALALGRPTSIDFRFEKFTFPIDTPSTQDRKRSAPQPRSETDPPTPVTMLISNSKFMAVLREILALETEGVHLKDYVRVEKTHQEVVRMIEDTPACLRSESPDTRFDLLPGCEWLPPARHMCDSVGAFVIMTLHKPYVFINPTSRHEAIKAGLVTLRAQRYLFQHVEAQHFKLFNLILSSFDAIVLLVAIYILHPTENSEYLHDSLQHFAWAMERFEKISSRNQMAKAALGVLQAIDVRLRRAMTKRRHKTLTTDDRRVRLIENTSSISTSSGYASTFKLPKFIGPSTSTKPGESSNTNTRGVTSDWTTLPPTNSSNVFPGVGVLPSASPDWGPLPPDFNSAANVNMDLSGMAPLQPMHDLLFNNLVGMSNDPAPAAAANAQTFYDPENVTPWKFEGEFRDDSFWNFMNQHNL